MTALSFIVPFSSTEHLDEDIAYSSAQSVIRRSNDWYGNYYDGFELREDVSSYVPLDSEEGEKIVADLLAKTREHKAKLLEKIIREVDQADSLEEAVTSEHLFHNARRLGAWRQPSGFLIDGARHSHGEPILNQDCVDDIRDSVDSTEELYLVNLEAYY